MRLGFGHSLEIQVVKDADAHGHERQLMQPQADRLRQARRGDIIRSIAADEGNATFLEEVRNVGVIPGKARCIWPRAQRGAPFPAARIKQDHVAGRNSHVLDLLQHLEILPVDGCARLQPSLGTRPSRKTRGVEQNAASHNAVLQRVDTASGTAAGSLDVIHRYAVVAFTVGHDVTVHRIEMAVNDSVIATRILVAIQSDTRTHVDHRPVQSRWSIDGAFLNHIVSQGYGYAILCEGQRLLSFGRRNEVRSAELVFFAPASPVGELFHGPPEIRIGLNRGARALGLSITNKETGRKHHDYQVFVRSFIVTPSSSMKEYIPLLAEEGWMRRAKRRRRRGGQFGETSRPVFY